MAPVVAASVSPQQYAGAQARLQNAQAACARADAYQGYVDSVVNSQNTVDQGVQQILQTLADNTSDPNLQDALLDAANQTNPISDALHQQLEGLAGTYEQTCQARLAAAQTAMPPDPSQQAGAASDSPATSTPATSPTDPQDPPDNQAGSAASDAEQSVPDTFAPIPPPQADSCSAVGAVNPPQPKSPWGSWAVLGNSGLVFDVSRVNPTTLTWRFLNAGGNTITAMRFKYSYVDANSGQFATQRDMLPFSLAPGQSAGGWTAYSANTRGNMTIAITQISCQ